MNDTELPVKIRSAINLRFIIRNPIATEHIKPIIPNLLDQYFKLMNELDNDDLIAALEELVDQFEDQMAPYATTLCAKLVCFFFFQLYTFRGSLNFEFKIFFL